MTDTLIPSHQKILSAKGGKVWLTELTSCLDFPWWFHQLSHQPGFNLVIKTGLFIELAGANIFAGFLRSEPGFFHLCLSVYIIPLVLRRDDINNVFMKPTSRLFQQRERGSSQPGLLQRDASHLSSSSTTASLATRWGFSVAACFLLSILFHSQYD